MFGDSISKAAGLTVIIGLVLACAPLDIAREAAGNAEATASAATGYDWYVATDGDDTYACNTPLRPCATLEGAIEKAADGDSVYIAEGSYAEPRTPGIGLNINRTLAIEGAGRDATVLDFSGNAGIVINSMVEVTMKNLTVQNVVRDEASPSGIGGYCFLVSTPSKKLVLEKVVVHNCGTHGLEITSSGPPIDVQLMSVAIIENGSYGLEFLGSVGHTSPLSIESSNISQNGTNGILLNNIELTAAHSDFEENGSSGIDMFGGTASLDHVSLLNNGGGATGAFLGGRPGGPPVAKAGLLIQSSDMEPVATVTNSTIEGNIDGVSLATRPGSSLDISGTTIKDNFRMGLRVESGNAKASGLTISGNGRSETIITSTERAEAGGVTVGATSANLELSESLVENNYGGVSVWGTRSFRGIAKIESTTIRGNSGHNVGGIFNKGKTFVSYSTISDNQGEIAAAGIPNGGVYNAGEMEISNTTISGSRGAGIVDSPWYEGVPAPLTARFITVSQNLGPGVAVLGSSPVEIEDSIVAVNSDGDCQAGDGATAAAYATSMDSDGSCGGLTASTDDLHLGPLADNGGPTQTHALLAESAAIDVAADCPASHDDQRYSSRPVGDGCDVGAYETNEQAAAPPTEAEVTAIQNANCRYGPSTAFEVADTLFKDQSAVIKGRNEENTWWQIQGPTFGTLCWVSYITVQVNGNPNAAPVVEGPPPPKEEEPEPAAQGCLVYDQYQNVVCAVPCPANPQPGGACTP